MAGRDYYETSEKAKNDENEGNDNKRMVAQHVCDMWHWLMDLYH